QHRLLLSAELGQHLFDDIPLLLPYRMTRVDHVQQEIRLVDFLERRAEARDEIVRQLANESNGIGQENLRVLAEVDLSRQRTERGNSAVFNEPLGRIPDRAQDRRLAGVGVANE